MQPGPDLQIRVGRGETVIQTLRQAGSGLQKMFLALRASFWSKKKGGRAPGAPTLDPPQHCTQKVPKVAVP